MPSVQAPSKLFDELATLFASGASREELLNFRPSQESIQRATELLELSRQNQLDDDQRREFDQYEQAELLMRLVKARIRANEAQSTRPS